jgi:hypothetical protein
MNRRRCLLLCTLAAPSICAAQPLGRLFYTPAERAQMEKTQPESTEITRYQGMVESSAGRRTVWVEGQPQPTETNPPDQKSVGGAQDELLRGGHIVVHPEK